MKIKKMLYWAAGLVVASMVVLITVALGTAKVEVTQGGVHKRLLIPIGKSAIGLQIYSGTGEVSGVHIKGHIDGPVVRRDDSGNWSATWFCEDQVKRLAGHSAALAIECAGIARQYSLATPEALPEVGSMPQRLVVISDLEGNLSFLNRSLSHLGVVNADGRWAYGAGQLLVLGDSVDRGKDALAVLWRLHELSIQARRAGGGVCIILGNHEQYALRGNVSRANAEHRYAMRQMGGAAATYGSDTVLGSWLRAQPVAVKLGDTLFVHGGVSPEVLESKYSISDLNQAMRDYWSKPVSPEKSAKLDAVLGPLGVTQYRGFFYGVEGLYEKSDDAHVERVLQHFDVKRVVVAHTLVERIENSYGGRVYAVDVNSDEASPELLVFEDGVPRVVQGVERKIGAEAQSVKRALSVFNREDRALIWEMVRSYRALSDISQPY